MAVTTASAVTVPGDTTEHPTADAFIKDERFHRKFTLPPKAGRPDPFCVTYSDYGYRNVDEPEREHVVLVCGPLLASRYLLLTKDKLAKKHGVRIINPDRPGFGGTTEVASKDRLQTWLDIVPALLDHLNIKHVTLLGYSGGTIYLLNTLLYLRHILHPTRPYVALCAPWIHYSQSRAIVMELTRMVPLAAMGKFDRLMGFIHSNIQPVATFSGNVIGSLYKSKPKPYLGDDPQSVEFEEKIRQQVIDRAFAENISGLSDDAMLLLKRDGCQNSWGPWADHDAFVPLLAALEEERAATTGLLSVLRVDVYFCESDIMIGSTKGPKWLDECWREEQRGPRIKYSSRVVAGTEHDTCLNLRFGVMENIFRAIVEDTEAPPSAAT